VKPFEQIVPDAAAFDAEVVGGLQHAVSHSITVTTMKARSEHAWKDQTYATRDSLEPEVTDESNGAHASLKAEGNAARLHEGTPPHRIEAKNARFLKFEMGGETMFRRAVNHPGTKPDPYLDNAAAAGEEDLDMAVDAALEQALG